MPLFLFFFHLWTLWLGEEAMQHNHYKSAKQIEKNDRSQEKENTHRWMIYWKTSWRILQNDLINIVKW